MMTKTWIIGAVSSVCLLALACGGGGGGGGDGTCETPGGRLYVGPYTVTNDTYMNSELPKEDRVSHYTMCASASSGMGDSLNASWHWSWPVVDSVRTRATPSVIFGFNPWDAASTTTVLPALVSDVGSLTVDAGVAQTLGSSTIADFGPVVYLTTSNQRSGSDPLPIAKRLFVYRNRYGTSSGTPAATSISIGGLSWDVYVSDYYVLYQPHTDADVPATSLHLELADFLSDAVDRGGIQSTWWVASVNTAMILYQGTGTLALTDYQVQFSPAP